MRKLERYWFTTDRGNGYGVTASSTAEAQGMLARYGYPLASERIVGVTQGVTTGSLDKEHVLPHAGPLVVRGVWYPRHNV